MKTLMIIYLHDITSKIGPLVLRNDKSILEFLGLFLVLLLPLCNWYGILRFDLLTIFRTGIVCTERDDTQIRRSIVDRTTLHPLNVEIVRILEMHTANEHGPP